MSAVCLIFLLTPEKSVEEAPTPFMPEVMLMSQAKPLLSLILMVVFAPSVSVSKLSVPGLARTILAHVQPKNKVFSFKLALIGLGC